MNVNRVLIMDDMPAARRWLREAVGLAFDTACCVETESLAHTRDTLARERFELFLCDLELPDGNGIGMIFEAQGLYPQMQVVVTTIHDEDGYLFPALRAGAQGYILKEHSKAEIAQMLAKAVRGEPPVSPSVARRLIGYFQAQEQAAAELTQRETEVLKIVAKGFTLAETAQALGISSNTAAGYLKSCYHKLQITSRAEATAEAIRLGIIH